MTTYLLVLLAALSAGLFVAVTVRQLAIAPRGVNKALAAYQVNASSAAPDLNAVLGLAAAGRERYVYLITAAAVVGLLLIGLPLVPALGGGALVYILTDSLFKSQMRKARLGIEQELPTFVSRLGGMLLVTASPRAAVEEIANTLTADKPLRIWLERLLAGWQAQGDAFLAQAHLEANRISPLLGLTVYQIRRLTETGSAGATKAFATTAEELSAILEARAVAGAKAEAARQAVLTMLVIMAAIFGLMISSPSIRAGYNNSTAQIVVAVALGMMGYGYLFLNDMINEALE